MSRTKAENRASWIVGIITLIILLGIAANTLIFQKKVNRVMEQYLLTSSQSQVRRISVQVNLKSRLVEDLADSFSRMPEFLLTDELLQRKAELLGFESMALLTLNDNSQVVYGEEGENLSEWLKDNEKQWEKNSCSLLEDHKAVYAAPVIKDDRTVGVIAGLQGCAGFYQLAEFENNWKNGVIVLKDLKSDKVLRVWKGEQSSIHERKIQDLIYEVGKSGNKASIRSSEYFAAVVPVDGTDWIQIAMVNIDDLVPYMSRHIVIYLILILLLFILFCIGSLHMKKNTKKMEKIFLTDPLTGGLNREGFLKQGELFLTSYWNPTYAVICLNICNFRRINEVWGEENGNKTLKFVHRMLWECVGDREVICRSFIDHFLILLHEGTEELASMRVNQIINHINSALQKEFYDYSLDFVVGGCLLDREQDLVSAVRNAVYASKNASEKNHCNFYNQEMMQKIIYENELDKLFYDAIKNRDFKIFLQPKISKTEPCQAEVLVRWLHPEKGIIYPNQFIPMFEQNGKILELDLYIFEETCRLLSKWIKTGQEVTEVSVNISRFTLQKLGKTAKERYKEIKEKYEIPDWLMEIEITETTLLSGNQLSYIQHILEGFHSCGFKVALDDFGFAYSSLGLLKSLEIDTVKLDRSFFVDENHKSSKIVASIIQLSHNLDMRVVAEGIEEHRQAQTLYEDGCDFIQGYVYSKPLSVDQFEEWRAQYVV